jgi:hypothetical protein
MRLDLVCTMFLRYTPRFPMDTRLAAVMPGHGVGAGYGEGTGHAVGDRLSGQLYWSNRPTVRSDNVVLGDFYGILLPDDGTYIVFSMRGYVVPWPGEPHSLPVKRDGIFGVSFQADHPDYDWVNSTYFVAESTVSAEHLVEVRAFSCTNEIGPDARRAIEGNIG